MMPTAALYQWNVAGAPLNILVELTAVDRFRTAAAASDMETGGILLGHFDGNYTVISDFELIESEHKRGSAYTLSNRDEARLQSRLEARRKGGLVVVGFFRSHLRPGMFLDEGDYNLISSYFHNASQVVLLVRPDGGSKATGGFFFWEEGEMNRKQTYLSFPMSSLELEKGDFPLVEPVANMGSVASNSATQTVDAAALSGHEPMRVPGASTTSERIPAETPRALSHAPETVERKPAGLPGPGATKPAPAISWPLIGLIAAGAAFGGYLIGTSGSHQDRFGARPGDITLDSNPPKPEAVPPPSSPPRVVSSESGTPAAVPTTSGTAPNAAASLRPSPMPPKAKPPQRVQAAPADPEPTQTTAETLPQPSVATPPVVPTEVPPTPGWQKFHQPSVENGGPAPVPTVTSTPAAQSTFYLEAVESGGLKRALGKVSLFGHYRGGPDYTPPQAVRTFAPRVSPELARQLNGPTPVDLRLKIDKDGKVISVEILSKDSNSRFIQVAGNAAYDWQFEPAKIKDKPVSSDVIAHFKFRPAE